VIKISTLTSTCADHPDVLVRNGEHHGPAEGVRGTRGLHNGDQVHFNQLEGKHMLFKACHWSDHPVVDFFAIPVLIALKKAVLMELQLCSKIVFIRLPSIVSSNIIVIVVMISIVFFINTTNHHSSGHH
jgi:hypothetical protein